jgi:hypothetical protein
VETKAEPTSSKRSCGQPGAAADRFCGGCGHQARASKRCGGQPGALFFTATPRKPANAMSRPNKSLNQNDATANVVCQICSQLPFCKRHQPPAPVLCLGCLRARNALAWPRPHKHHSNYQRLVISIACAVGGRGSITRNLFSAPIRAGRRDKWKNIRKLASPE